MGNTFGAFVDMNEALKVGVRIFHLTWMGDNQLFYILLALFQKNSLLPDQKYANKSLEMLLRLNGEKILTAFWALLVIIKWVVVEVIHLLVVFHVSVDFKDCWVVD